ncbi:MAG: DUF5110 domain-containing protein [Pseudomonadota bacterium]|nr:DUF5110 domain-containing protein [Pseudomonadota bacterium]
MYFGQKVHPLNFEYGSTLKVDGDAVAIAGSTFSAQIRCDGIADFCIRLRIDNANVADKRNYSDGIIEHYRQGRPVAPRQEENAVFDTAVGRVGIGPSRLEIQLNTGTRLETAADGIGFNGEKFILNLDVGDATGFYGFGERTGHLNKSGESMDFWTVDVVAVFPYSYARSDYDPAYVAIPLAIIKSGDSYCGLYFDNPERAVLDVEKTHNGRLMYQSMGGNTDIYVIAGPRLRDVVRRFTTLTGRNEVPPLWSLGYHQCRWGYKTEADFLTLKDDFERHDIPVSVLWYDIDYMDGYRVFTWDKEEFPAPARLNNALKEAGIRTVTIVDPGVKLDPGYPIYDQGRAAQAFCQTLSGRDYVGRVWPGDTVFPDFTLEAAQDWWAGAMAAFLRDSALDGVWLDMNDPATGYSDDDDMRFQHAAVPHAKYHNQYAHFMARASRKAFDRLDPDGRPFLLTRSAFTGTQRYSAVWTGDNASNWSHLRMSIPCTLNLGLSGVAFNGPDVGGFMGHTTPELLVRWYLAGFLFPFFRNHSGLDSKTQEPWEFDKASLATIRDAITTRYRLLPYLYACFFHHYLTGDPVLRPLLYEYDGGEYENLDDEYLVGADLLAAPIVHGEGGGREVVVRGEKCHLRYVTLPPGWWFDLNLGRWTAGGRTFPYAAGLEEVPLFARDGAIIPYYNGPLRNSQMELNRIELHVFVKERPGAAQYYIDDQQTRGYQQGRYNSAKITAAVSGNEFKLDIAETGDYPAGTVAFTPVLYGRQEDVKAVIALNGRRQTRTLTQATRRWVCKELQVLA